MFAWLHWACAFKTRGGLRPAPSVHINKAEQDWFSVDIWRTHEMPAKIVPKAVEEPTAGPRRQMPTTNGTVLRINSFPPESEAVRTMTPADSLRVFEGLGNPKAATFGKGGRHPMMHRTEFDRLCTDPVG